MALTEKPNPIQPRIYVDDLGDQSVLAPASRGGWRRWWILPVILALAAWWAGWGWGGSGGWWWGRSAHTSVIAARTAATPAKASAQQPLGGGPQPMSGPGVPILTAPAKQAFIGRQFAANDIPVRQRLSSHALWVGEKNSMLAVVTGNRISKGVKPGELVDAIGTVRKSPPEAQAKRKWNLSSKDASRLEHEGAYLEVSQLSLPLQ